MKRLLPLALVVAFGASALAARPRHGDPEQCDERCKRDAKECEEVCRQYASPKALKFCTQACEKVHKECQDACVNKKKK